MESDEFREHLGEERARLAEIRDTYDEEHLATSSEDAAFGEHAFNAQRQLDLGSQTFSRDQDLTVLEQIDAQLADVEHALRRLDDGTYGLCEACGSPIGEERLRAIPAARFCIDDQAVAERRGPASTGAG
jgi:RNA polymerase-binding transcription factor DksA